MGIHMMPMLSSSGPTILDQLTVGIQDLQEIIRLGQVMYQFTLLVKRQAVFVVGILKVSIMCKHHALLHYSRKLAPS